MKQLLNTILIATLLTLSFSACNTDDSSTTDDTTVISEEVLFQVKKLGFSTEHIIKEEDGYIVEGDIFLHEADLFRTDLHQHSIRIAETEQYHTTNLVTSLPRVITVSVASTLSNAYRTALDLAIARYNAEGLSITFQRIPGCWLVSITDKIVRLIVMILLP